MQVEREAKIYQRRLPSGNTTFRVDTGRVNGKRQTKDFRHEVEALKCKAQWDAEIQRKNLGALQDLAAVNKREILLALERLAPFNASILDVADFYIRYAMPAKGPITSLPSDLRRFATFDGRGLFAIDVGNCQPALLSRLYSADCDEKRRYVALVKENRFYGHLNEKLSLPFDLSDSTEKREFKQRVFHKIFYGSNWGEAVELTDVFRREFPKLFDAVRNAKKRHHRDLPVSLQKLEAETVIDGVASEFARKHAGETVCPISLHDCLITAEEHVDELKTMIEGAFRAQLGFAPPVTVARFSDDTTEGEFGETLIAA